MRPALSRTARLRVLGRRGVHRVAFGSRIRIWLRSAWWDLALHRNGALHAPMLPAGWRVELGRRRLAADDARNERARDQLWIVVDAPSGVTVEIAPMPEGRR